MSFINSKDTYYPLEEIFQYFTNENCPTLKDKPRLFFIQACQGKQLDSGIDLVEMDGNVNHDNYDSVPSIDNNALRPPIDSDSVMPKMDFLLAYSTSPKHYSFRCEETGTWFIKELCRQLDENRENRDYLNMLTCVSRRVAINYESSNKFALYDKKGSMHFNNAYQIGIFPKKTPRKLLTDRANIDLK